MERSRSVPVDGSTGHAAINPWYSDKVKDQCLLDAARPSDLPTDEGYGDLSHSHPGFAAAQRDGQSGPTGKGRGSSSAGMLSALEPTVDVSGPLFSEGKLPEEGGVRSMGPVEKPKKQSGAEGVDSLQRELEGELVAFLRTQNSKLMEELQSLKDKLEKTSATHADSGVDSSPWSTVGGVDMGDRTQNHEHGRQGRMGSRTPRSRVREVAASPERRVSKGVDLKYTPNGTRVPDGPPPMDVKLPPVPPLPTVVVSDGDPQQQSSFVSGINDAFELYDTCDSKPKVKNGDMGWKPKGEPEGPLSASEAKQLWMERELRSLKFALDRASIPPVVQQSSYWNPGFEGKLQSCLPGSGLPARGDCVDGDNRASHLHGDQYGPVRASSVHGTGQDQDRASQLHGAPHEGARAQQLHGVHLGQGRAPYVHGAHHEQARAQHAHGAHSEQGRAQHVHGVPHEHDRPSLVHGDLFGQDRAFPLHGDLPGHGRAFMDDRRSGLHPNGPPDFCHLPGHGVGGGGCGDGDRQGKPHVPWPENAGTTMNTKGELPELPSDSSPLQFGDWLHLIAPVMKDISGVAGWWWETTSREARGFYEDWKRSNPLQRIQIVPRLPQELHEQQFLRTEQRGIQMLLNSNR